MAAQPTEPAQLLALCQVSRRRMQAKQRCHEKTCDSLQAQRWIQDLIGT